VNNSVAAVAKQAQVALATQQRYVKTIACLKDLLTNADLFADGLIRRELLQVADYSYFSEECESRPYTSDVWIVDPLDGTANYLAQDDHWTASIYSARFSSLLKCQ
jgi:fructose-1,6-bisphosphatase/inositol monophosphatase family enzyme